MKSPHFFFGKVNKLELKPLKPEEFIEFYKVCGTALNPSAMTLCCYVQG